MIVTIGSALFILGIYTKSSFLRGLSKPKMLKEKNKMYITDISLDIMSNMMTPAGL